MNADTHYRRHWRLFLLCVIALTVSACTTIANKGSNGKLTATFVLAPTLPTAHESTRDGPIIVVLQPGASAEFNTSRIAYTQQQYVLQYYALNEWVNPPADMLAPLLRDTLNNTGQFAAVVPHTSRALAEIALDTELESLLHVYESNRSYARVALNVQVIDLVNRRLLATRKFIYEEPATAEGPAGGVMAFNKALESALVDIGQFTARTVQENR